MKKDTSTKVIVLILVTTLFVGLAIILRKDKIEINKYSYETDLFKNLDTAQTLDLFKNLDKASLLFIGRQNCQGCSGQAPHLQVASIKYHFPVYHLDLDTIDSKTKEAEDLIKKLDYEYELDGKKALFGQFLGYTPMIIIIKGGSQVYGHIGPLTDDEIHELILKYGVI